MEIKGVVLLLMALEVDVFTLIEGAGRRATRANLGTKNP
jgi:hypothetical protein